MKQESNFNIFDPSSHRPKTPKKPSAPISPPKKSSEPSTSSEDPELLLKKMHEKQKEIQSRLENTYTKGGVTPKSLEEYVHGLNPSFRTKTEQDFKKLEADITDVVGKTPKSKRRIRVGTAAHAEKERKGKTLGSRKKWIPMK
ncbi:MAG: hypothetical protein H0X51_01140 [Parachlamydiaceae bacterium]|nr:hypothetical protein [Parachlamydiaceae bacterium]